MREILLEVTDQKIFDWFSFDDFRKSESNRVELFFDDVVIDSEDEALLNFGKNRMLSFALELIEPNKKDLLTYVWDCMPLDLIEISENSFETNRHRLDVSSETAMYMEILKVSGVPESVDSCCKCNNWPDYMSLILDGTLSHIFDYVVFFNKQEEYLFYFHHTFEFGIYYKNPDFIHKIKYVADKHNFQIKD